MGQLLFISDFDFLLQWGAAYCVKGGPEKEKKAMEVGLYRFLFPLKLIDGDNCFNRSNTTTD